MDVDQLNYLVNLIKCLVKHLVQLFSGQGFPLVNFYMLFLLMVLYSFIMPN